jgi:hypothetical protein
LPPIDEWKTARHGLTAGCLPPRTDICRGDDALARTVNPQQRDRFFQAGLRAALRLNPPQFRAWLLRRLKNHPLAPAVDLVRFAISDADMALLLKQLPSRPDDADRGTRR